MTDPGPAGVSRGPALLGNVTAGGVLLRRWRRLVRIAACPMRFQPSFPSTSQLLAGFRQFMFRNDLLPFRVPLSFRDTEFDTDILSLLRAGERKVPEQPVDQVKISSRK